MAFERYRAGDKLSGLIVIKPKGERTQSRYQKYLVQYDCCGEVGEITHPGLTQRERKGVTLCATCSKRFNGQTYGHLKKKA